MTVGNLLLSAAAGSQGTAAPPPGPSGPVLQAVTGGYTTPTSTNFNSTYRSAYAYGPFLAGDIVFVTSNQPRAPSGYTTLINGVYYKILTSPTSAIYSPDGAILVYRNVGGTNTITGAQVVAGNLSPYTSNYSIVDTDVITLSVYYGNYVIAPTPFNNPYPPPSSYKTYASRDYLIYDWSNHPNAYHKGVFASSTQYWYQIYFDYYTYESFGYWRQDVVGTALSGVINDGSTSSYSIYNGASSNNLSADSSLYKNHQIKIFA